CGHPDLVLVVPECACACLTRRDRILPSCRGVCIPQPHPAPEMVTILILQIPCQLMRAHGIPPRQPSSAHNILL
ncbi:MAG: hypothetical protein KBH25_07705, partial [Aeromonadaceae bacterium]|nr:hypothetical protein [Aeromonadaceae bacterium]